MALSSERDHEARRFGAAFVALLDERGRVLLVWRHRFVPDRWGWELPGGLIDEDEEPVDAATRELEEETSYRAGRVEHLVTFQPMPGMVDSEHVAFVGRESERVADAVDVNEVTRMEWVPLDSVPGPDHLGRHLERGHADSSATASRRRELAIDGTKQTFGLIERKMPGVARGTVTTGSRRVRLELAGAEKNPYTFAAEGLDAAAERGSAG